MFCLMSSTYANAYLEGTWIMQQGSVTESLVFIDGYVSHVVFEQENKKFISTRGGKYSTNNDLLIVEWQYDTEKAKKGISPENWLGKENDFTWIITDNQLKTDFSERVGTWFRQDDGNGSLSGVWRMSGRKDGENISDYPLRDRRTLKILTGTRFQWVAIDIQTGEFFGTGGGRYTFKNGKYTEHIDFFSRDNSRVGASLVFDGKVKDGKWHHSGNSSKGDFIYEIWAKLES